MSCSFVLLLFLFFFVFKQKTAYEMRISDWSSDVCSSDLHRVADLTSGFRVVRAERFREFLHLLPNGFSYPTTSTMAFFRSAYPVDYMPIQVAKRVGNN